MQEDFVNLVEEYPEVSEIQEPLVWQIQSIFTYMIYSYTEYNQKSYMGILLLYLVTVAQMYMMMGLSVEYTYYMSANDWFQHNEHYFCLDTDIMCIGKLHVRTILSMIGCMGVIILQVMNEYEQIRIANLALHHFFNSEHKYSTSDTVYYHMLKFTAKIRTYITLISVANSAMNMYIADISIPGMLLNGLTCVFVLSIDDIIYTFWNGMAYTGEVKLCKRAYDRLVTAKNYMVIITMLLTLPAMFYIINFNLYSKQTTQDQILILGSNLLMGVMFFIVGIIMQVINNRDKKSDTSIYKVVFIEVIYILNVAVLSTPIMWEYYINYF